MTISCQPDGRTPAAASSTLEEWTHTFNRGQQLFLTIGTVYHSSKTVKRQSKTAKNDHWCTIGTLLLHCWYSLGKPVTIGTPMVIFAVFDCLLTVFDEWYTVPIVKNSQKTVNTAKWPLVYQSSQVYQDCTNSVKIVYQSSIAVKKQSNSKNDH